MTVRVRYLGAEYDEPVELVLVDEVADANTPKASPSPEPRPSYTSSAPASCRPATPHPRPSGDFPMPTTDHPAGADLVARARQLAFDAGADPDAPVDPEPPAGPRDRTVDDDVRDEARAALDSPYVPVRRGATAPEIDAAVAAAGHAGTARRMALGMFRQAGPQGLTDSELADRLNAIPNRIATRRKELAEAGLVEEAPVPRRPTHAGIPARVHRITELGLAVTNRPAPANPNGDQHR